MVLIVQNTVCQARIKKGNIKKNQTSSLDLSSNNVVIFCSFPFTCFTIYTCRVQMWTFSFVCKIHFLLFQSSMLTPILQMLHYQSKKGWSTTLLHQKKEDNTFTGFYALRHHAIYSKNQKKITTALRTQSISMRKKKDIVNRKHLQPVMQ